MSDQYAQIVARLAELERERAGRPAVQVCEEHGRVDYIDPADRKAGEDRSGSGLEWFTENVELYNVLIDADEDESPLILAAETIAALGLTETSSAPDFYDPDGSQVENYQTADECRRTARLFGFTDAEVSIIAETVETSTDRGRVLVDARNLDPETYDAESSYSGPGRFEGTDRALAVALEIISLHGFADEESGDVDALGHAARVGRFLLVTDSQGFRTAETYDTDADAEHAAREYDGPAE